MSESFESIPNMNDTSRFEKICGLIKINNQSFFKASSN